MKINDDIVKLVESTNMWDDVNDGTLPSDDVPVSVTEPSPDDVVSTTPVTMTQPTDIGELPVDDESYAPTSMHELGLAVRQLLSDVDVPDSEAPQLWTNIRDYIMRMTSGYDEFVIDRIDDDATQPDERFQLSYDVNESHVRHMIRRIVEVMGDKFVDIDKLVDDNDTDISDINPHDDVMTDFVLSDDDYEMLKNIDTSDNDDVDLSPRGRDKKKHYNTAGEEGMSLKDMAKELGYSGPSGVKNLLYKIEDKIRYFASLDDVWFKNLMTELAMAYVEELRDAVGENLDDDDKKFLDELMDNPDDVLSSPNFRMWAQQFLKQVYKKQLGKRRED